MDLGSLIPQERVVDVLDPRNDEPTGLKLTIAHNSDPRVIKAQRKLWDEVRSQDDESEKASRGVQSLAMHVVGWDWTGSANFKGDKPKFTTEKLLEVYTVPAVASAVYRTVTDEAGFYAA